MLRSKYKKVLKHYFLKFIIFLCIDNILVIAEYLRHQMYRKAVQRLASCMKNCNRGYSW